MIPNTLARSLNIPSSFLWNISPFVTAPNGNPLHLYLADWHAHVVRYDDLSSNFKLWYPDVASIRERYCALFNLQNISLSIGPLWTGLISAWLTLAGSRHNLTFPFSFGTNTKLLHDSAVSFLPSGAIISYYCSHSNSSLNDLAVHMLHILEVSGMDCYLVWPVMKMYH